MVIQKPIMVAELSINHLGMVKIAQKMIDGALNGGADLVKLKYKDVDKYYKNDGKKWGRILRIRSNKYKHKYSLCKY